MNSDANSINSIIKRAQYILKEAGVAEYERDGWLLSEYVFGIDRRAYYMNPEFVPEQHKVDEYFDAVSARAKRQPLQYITGRCEFMGMTFNVCRDVLIPRQDTEILVECAMGVIKKICAESGSEQDSIKALDMCTGTGCIGISIAKYTGAAVTCADISGAALECAKKNAEELCCENIEFVKTDLFADIHGEYDIIVSNPPYIRKGEINALMSEVRDYEPVVALNGGEDGLEFYRNITSASGKHLCDNGIILYEIGCEQAEDVSRILRDNNYNDIEVIKDLAGLNRVVKARKERRNV